MTFRVADLPRGSDATVTGGSVPFAGFSFEKPLLDDGHAGDEVSGDGVFSATVEVPGNLRTLAYRFLRDGVPELVSIAGPARPGDRRIDLGRGPVVIAPVQKFAHLALMAELTHPDAEGHAVIAAGLVDAITALPTFRR